MSDAPASQRHTPQREAILRVIRRAHGPLTTGEIHKRARRLCPKLGIATVYRNVKLLLETDMIQPVILPDGETRYELAGLSHHHHFHCEVCHRVYDLDGCPVTVRHGMTLPGGFIVSDHELTLYGTCPRCASSEPV